MKCIEEETYVHAVHFSFLLQEKMNLKKYTTLTFHLVGR